METEYKLENEICDVLDVVIQINEKLIGIIDYGYTRIFPKYREILSDFAKSVKEGEYDS